MDFFFFDADGSAWRTCSPNHPQAEAFGPRGCARPAAAAEFGVAVSSGETDFAAASAAGRVDDSGEWSVVA